MTQTQNKRLTFKEYLTYDDGTDNRYELINGELVMVPLPTAEHSDINDLLYDAFRAEISRQRQPWIVKRDVGVYTRTDPVTGKDYSRTPDLCVITSLAWAELKADKTSAAVLRTPPLLVVEVVSPSSKKTDYERKKSEYKARRVPEYCIVNLRNSKVSVLLLVDSHYEPTEFRGSASVVSQIFPELTLRAEQVLSA